MAKPQTEDGFVRIANELFDALARTRIPGEARQVLDVIFRQTYGWNRKEAAISLSHFVDATGIKRSNVQRSIRTLLNMNLVIRIDYTPASKYRINKDFDTWQASKLRPVIKTDYRGESKMIIEGESELITEGESKAITATPFKPLPDMSQLEPKDSIKDIYKDISLPTLSQRERLLKEMKKIFPALSFIPDSIPDEKLDFLVYKVGKGEIRADSIKNPLAYLKAMTVSETFPSFIEREAKAERKRQEEQERREREREEEEKAHQNREYHRDKAREVINKLSGRGTWKTSTRSGTSIEVQ